MKIKRNYIILLFLFLILFAHSNKLQNAFEALSLHNYFKAKQLFKNLNKKNGNPYASYGLSLIYYRNNNPFHNYDSALKYANLSLNLYKVKGKPSTIKSFTIDSLTLVAMVDSIGEKLLKVCLIKNTIYHYNQFLQTNYLASSAIRKTAIYNRDELEYNHVVNINKSDTTLLFKITHPLSAFKNDAHKLLERQVFEEITAPKSAASYIYFIESQPTNANIKLAYEELLILYKNTKDKAGVVSFIKNYQLAPQVQSAWQLLFGLSVKKYSSLELESFITNYPNFPFKNSILKELELNNLTLLPVQVNDLIGFADTSGIIQIQPIFDEATPFKEGLSLVHKGDSVYFINKENTNTINQNFNEAFPFFNGLAPVKIKSKWYLMDRLGETKTPPYDEINDLSEEYYVLKLNNLYGALNQYGEVVVDIKFEKLGDFKNDCAYYQSDGRYGFITKNGYVHKAEFEWISAFSANGLATYKLNNKFGLIKNNGQPLTAAVYDQIIKITESIYAIIVNNNYGFYSSEGCFLTAIDYDYENTKPESFYSNGTMLKLIKKNNQALVDLNGKIIIDFGTYTELNFAGDGLFCVKKNNKYGFINQKLNIIIPFKYISAQSFLNNVAEVETKTGFALINTNGEELLKSESPIKRITPNYFTSNVNDVTNMYNNLGKLVFSDIQSYDVFKNYLIVYLQNNVIKIVPI